MMISKVTSGAHDWNDRERFGISDSFQGAVVSVSYKDVTDTPADWDKPAGHSIVVPNKYAIVLTADLDAANARIAALEAEVAAPRAAKPAGEVWEPVGVEEIASGVVHTSNGGDPHRMLVDENRRQVVAIPAGYALCRRRTEGA
jgi:hypothetical protein